MSAFAEAVYGMMLVSMLSFFFGYVVIGKLLKNNGLSKDKVIIACQLVTLSCLVLGFST